MNIQEVLSVSRLTEKAMSVLGDRIKEARESIGLTQEELGQALGVTGITVYRWESDKGYPRIQQLEKASELLKRPVYWFFLPYGIDQLLVGEDDLRTLCDLYRSLNATGKAKLLSTAVDFNELSRYH